MNSTITYKNQNRLSVLRRSLALLAAMTLALASSYTQESHAAEPSAMRISGVVNLNTANLEQLQLLPGVGEKRAAAIVEIRKSKGGFKAVEELTEVKGVGDALIERLRPHLTVSGKTTAQRL